MQIDTSRIPAADVRPLCVTLLDAVQTFFEDPNNQRQYEEWLLAEEKQKEAFAI